MTQITVDPPPSLRRRGNPNLAPRCGAKARTTGCPCQAPAMANGRCRMHGGKSTGPRTPEGLARLAAARTKHGTTTARYRAICRYQRTLMTRARLFGAAVEVSSYLPRELAARLPDYPEELMRPPHPTLDLQPHASPKTRCNVARCAPSRDAHGRVVAGPQPELIGRKAEREAARQERAALAPWRAAIRRARLIKRLLTLQAQNARRAKRAQRSTPTPCLETSPGGEPRQPDATMADYDSPAATRREATTGPIQKAGQNPIQPRAVAQSRESGQDPIHPRSAGPSEESRQDPLRLCAAVLSTSLAQPGHKESNKSPMQRDTVVQPSGPDTATTNHSGNAAAQGKLPVTAAPQNASPAGGSASRASNPFRMALLTGTASTSSAGHQPAAQGVRGPWHHNAPGRGDR